MFLGFEDGKFEVVKTGKDYQARWVVWRRDGTKAFAVGNNGLVLEFDGRKFARIHGTTSGNLRCASYDPRKDEVLLVGNKGTLFLLEDGEVRQIRLETTENLRRVSWSPDGSQALILGNNGTLLLWDRDKISEIGGAFNNLRSVSWHAQGEFALVSGNYFAAAMVPSPTLYRFRKGADRLEALRITEKTDLISIEWKPNGEYAVAVGYEVVWQEPRVFQWNDKDLEEIPLQARGLFPTAIGWHPSGEYALIGTGSPLPRGEGEGSILRYEDGQVEKLYSGPLRIGSIAWRPDGSYALIVGSRSLRTFRT